jgi:hypothetical protein
MSTRKKTPDILGEILSSPAPAATELELPPAQSAPARQAQTRSAKPRPLAPQSLVEKRRVWEYRVVSFQDYKGWRPRFIDGKEVEDWTSGPALHDYLAEMGQAGWDLAAASSGEHLYGTADRCQLYFKRVK